MTEKLETKIAAVALVSFIVVGAVCALSYRSVHEARATSRMVAHTYEVLTELNAAVGNLTDAEAGTRGYLLTGDNSYLERQTKNFVKSRAALRELAGSTRDDAAQQARLASLRQKFEDKIAFLEETTRLRQTGSEESAREFFETGRGREIMDEVGETAGAFEASERLLLGQRQRNAAASTQNTEKLVLIAGAVNGLLLALTFLAIRREMIAREQLENRLRDEAKKLAAMNEELEAFSYSVSHDLRAPLRHISGFAELLRQHLGDRADAKVHRFINVVGESTRHMGVLIDQLLAFARMGRADLQRSKVDLGALVRSLIDLQVSVNGRDIEWQIGPLPEVQADAGLIRQVFTNLIENAVKYTRSRPRAVIEIRGEKRNGEFLFYVRDNGVGFDPQYAGKLFGVFQRLHQSEEFEGTGIGLANVRRVIQKHGGRTWADAELERRRYFLFHPANRNHPLELNTMPTILLCEDSEIDAELTLNALAQIRESGQVDVVRDGVEALDYLYRRNKYAGRTKEVPSLVLLDVKMPRLDGLEVLRRIKKDRQLRSTPVVMLTSSRHETDLVESYEAGANAYVVKPVEFDKFAQVVRETGQFWTRVNEPAPAGRTN